MIVKLETLRWYVSSSRAGPSAESQIFIFICGWVAVAGLRKKRAGPDWSSSVVNTGPNCQQGGHTAQHSASSCSLNEIYEHGHNVT